MGDRKNPGRPFCPGIKIIQHFQTATPASGPRRRPHETERRIPEEKKSGCVALLRELIEAVVSHSNPQAGGPND
jgi:hypothetical protein